MGIYLNPTDANFREIINQDIYVDKTMMIAAINRIMDKGNKYVCVSRPRRFGKTIAGDMLAAYYTKGCDGKTVFSDLKIAQEPEFEEKLNRYNVIKLDMNSELQNTEETDNLFKIITEKIKFEIREEYPEILLSDFDSLADSILKVFSKTGDTFVIIMDEYDVFVREEVSEELFKKYLKFLNGLYKSATVRPAIALAYLTGILPIVRDKIQSKLNNFDEYTILDAGRLAEYVGFTDAEVEDLCNTYDMDYIECKRWYDGYNQRGVEIYNPKSVTQSMLNQRFNSYWNMTSSYMAIAERIRMNFAGTKDAVVRMLAGENVDVNVTRFMNTMTSFTNRDDVFTYLLHLGYLAYSMDEQTCRIPNKEVRIEWFNAIATESGYEETNRIIEDSKALLQATIDGNEAMVAKALDVSHIQVTSNRSYNNEDALQSAIYLAYIYALNEYTVIKEMTTGKGFADVVFIPFKENRPAMIIELKRNQSTDSAINQIKEKRYFDSLKHYQGQLLFVGINYDEKEKTHACKIEWMEKNEMICYEKTVGWLL